MPRGISSSLYELIGQVALEPDLRRGIADLDGTGEAVSGIIVMRRSENALEVIGRVK